MGAAAGLLGRWFVGVAVLLNAGVFQLLWRCRSSATRAHRALPLYDWAALGMPWATARSNTASAVCSRCAGLLAGAACYVLRVIACSEVVKKLIKR